MNWRQILWYSGIWVLLVSSPLAMAIAGILQQVKVENAIISSVAAATVILPLLMVYLNHRQDYYRYYRDDFSPITWLENRDLKLSKAKKHALYSRPRRKYLYKKPTGLVLAKTRNRYVCVPVKKNYIVNMLLVGGPGSGKSAGNLISSLAVNFANKKPMACFCIDIKGELHTASVHDDDDRVIIINPDDPNSPGWDTFYSLTQSSSDDEVKDLLQKIAEIIIVETNEKNAFFSSSARKIFVGVHIYLFRKQVWTSGEGTIRSGFSDAMVELATREPSELIKTILEDKETCDKHLQISAELRSFLEADSEAFTGIKLSLQQSLSVFTMDSVRRLLSEKNKRRASPLDLNRGKSIFVAIPENRLTTLASLFRMITFQTLNEMENRPVASDPVLMSIDEFPRLGRLGRSSGTEVSGIFSAMSTLRGRGVAIAPLALQDLSQARSIYSENESAQLFSLSSVICVLDTKDLATGEMLSKMSGFYEETKTSRNRNAISKIKNPIENASAERRPVVDVADIARLREEGGVMMWIEGRYCRARRIRWYEDSIIRPIVEENLAYNDMLRTKKINKEPQDADDDILFFDDGDIEEDASDNSQILSEYYMELFKK